MVTMKYSVCNEEDSARARALFERYATTRLHWLKDPIQHDRLLIIKRFLSGCRDGYILDNGCGEVEPVLVSNNARTVGLDISKVALQDLKAKTFKGHIVLGSALKLPFKDKAFEKAICSDVIEHLPTSHDVARCLQELNRIAKEYMLTTPNCGFGADWYALTYADHKRFYSIADLRRLLGSNAVCETSNLAKNLFPFFIRSHSARRPILTTGLLSPRPSRSTPLSLILYHSTVVGRKLQTTRLGKLLMKLKRKAFGGAFITAFVRMN